MPTLPEALADILAVARGGQDPHAGELAEEYIAEQTRADTGEESNEYDDATVAELKDEVNRRNDQRGPGEPLIVVKGKGNKEDIIAALQEDDTRREE